MKSSCGTRGTMARVFDLLAGVAGGLEAGGTEER